MDFLRRRLPSREQIAGNRWLRWLGPGLLHPKLWHFSRRGVAVGVALGVFFGLLIPVAQIPLAAGVAVLLRANLPAAVGSTLITNPLTFAPIYVLAHRLGNAVLGDESPAPPLAAAPRAPQADAGWWDTLQARVLALGRPLLLGLAILAACAGILTYVLIMLGWRLRTAWTWRRRRTKAEHGA
jgi:hypothetical protein